MKIGEACRMQQVPTEFMYIKVAVILKVGIEIDNKTWQNIGVLLLWTGES